MKQHKSSESDQSTPRGGPTNRIPRWILRIPLYVVFSVVVLVGVGVLVLQTPFVQDRLRIFIAETASSHLNATVSIGHMEGNILSGVTFEKIRLASPDTTPVVSIDSLSIHYLLPKMLFSIIHIENLSLNGVRLDLEKSSDGDWNLPNLSNTSGEAGNRQGVPFPFRLNVSTFDLADAQITVRQGSEITSFTVNRFIAGFEYGRSIQLSITDASLEFTPPGALQVSLSGDLAFDPAVSDLTVDGLSLESGASRVVLDGSCSFAEDNPVFSFLITAPSIHLAELSESFSTRGLPDAVGSGTLHVSGTPKEFQHELSFDLDGAALEAEGSGGIDATRGFWTDLTASVRTLDLSKGWPPLKDILSGTVSSDFHVNATGLQSPESIVADASLELRGATVSGILLDHVRLSANWSHEALSIEQLEVASSRNRLDLSGAFNPISLETQIKLTASLDQPETLVDSLSKRYPEIFNHVTLGGIINVAVAAQGPVGHPSARFSVTSRDVAFDSYHADDMTVGGVMEGLPGAGHRIDDITIALQGVSGDRFRASDLSLKGAWSGWLAHPVARVTIASNDVSLFSYQAVHMDLKGLWRGIPGPENQMEDVELRLQGVVSDLFRAESVSLNGNWSGWLETPDTAFSISALGASLGHLRVDDLHLSGSLQGLPAAENAAADIAFSSDGIHFNDIDVQTLTLSANWRGPINGPSGRAAVEAENAAVSGERFTQLSLTGTVSPADATVDLSASHENGSRAEIEGIVSSWNAGTKAVTLNKLFASTTAPWPESTISNIEPLRFTLDGDTMTIDGCRLAINRAILSMHGELSPEGIQGLDLHAESLDISSIPGNWNDRAGLSGTVSANVTLNGPWARPRFSFDIRGTDLTGYGISQATDLTAAIDYADATTSVHASLTKQGKQILTADGSIPLSLSLSPFSVTTGAGEMDAAITSRDLRFSELPIPQIKGIEWDAVADINLSMSGNIRTPDLLGDIRIRDGYLTLTRNKLTYETIEGSILLENHRINIDNLLIEGNQEGRLMVTGAFSIREGYDFDADLTLSGNNFYIPFQKAISARISPDLHLTGGLSDPSLTGELTISESRINLDRLSRQRLSDIQVVETQTPDSESPVLVASQSGGSDFLSPLSADILVRVPRNAWLKGQDVNAEISGEITVSKRPGEAFVLTGPLKTLRGNYYFMGKNFQLTEGKLEFLGLREINPNLNIVAKTRIKPVTIIVALHGSVQDISVDLSSEPTMDESDIISYLMFGRPTDNLGGDQAFSVEKAAMNYVGGLLAVELRDLLGGIEFIDTLSIDPTSGENSTGSVTLGKYVTPDLFISHSQSLSENEPSFQDITYELSPRLKLETQIGKKNSSSIDLTWEYDF